MPKPRMGRPPLPPEQKSERVVLYLLPDVVDRLDAVARDDAARFGHAVSRSSTVALLLIAAHERLIRRKAGSRAR